MSDYGQKQWPSDNGAGRVWENKNKTNPKAPDWTGKLVVDGIYLKVSMWAGDGTSGNSIKTRPMSDEEKANEIENAKKYKERREQEAAPQISRIGKTIEPFNQPAIPVDVDDEIPF